MSANGTDGQTPMAPQRPQMQQQATRRKFWGWGLESEGLTASEIEQLGGTFAALGDRCRARPGAAARG